MGVLPPAPLRGRLQCTLDFIFRPQVAGGMVYFLISDVLCDFWDIPTNHLKSCIASGPFEFRIGLKLIIGKKRGYAFHSFGKIGHSNCSRDRQQHVYMISSTPLMASTLHPISTATAAINRCRRRSISGRINGTRSQVLHTK